MEAQTDRSRVEDVLFSPFVWQFLGGIFSVALAFLLAGMHSRKETIECLPKFETAVVKYWRYPSRNVPAEIKEQARPGDEIIRIRHVFAWASRFQWETAEFVLVRGDIPILFHRELGTPIALHLGLIVVLPLLLGTAFGRLMNRISWKPAGSGQAVAKDPGVSGWRKGLPYLLTGVAVFFGICRASMDTSPSSTAAARALIQMTAAQYLLPHEAEGFWIGDVAELYRWGGIPRRVAEADARPRKALVDWPRPFREYLFVAMEGGPVSDVIPNWDPAGLRNTVTFGFCAYPAESGVQQDVWIMSRVGLFKRKGRGEIPVLHWPRPEELKSDWIQYEEE